ncbi:hypothetical protein SAMN05192583_1868 [Sphingomonas gellani]|uniref:TPR repeat n=1 Tax=Sphingomonas gellani TaxID=1166340 RepID=A0A1H8DD50_9SPHN|nr:tetratricopeptide repeat protein [Sphingomonas gellani]SEN04704.1 hypothetical protein SAMN05192583_1868 [Sphingomonas gellani]
MLALDALSNEDIQARLAAPAAERAAFLRAAAEAGHAEAQLVYAQMLLDGADVAADPRAALGWFVKAAAQHNAMALNMVGRCYDLGWGTQIDKARAVACFRVAAELGLVEAMYNHATLLALGEGVAEDKVAALTLFERAAALGYAKAINHIGSFAEDGWVHQRDMAKAADCYARAAEAGDFRGQFNHARMLIDAGNVDAALPWLARAAAGGTPAFVDKAVAWLRATGDARLTREGVAAMRNAC